MKGHLNIKNIRGFEPFQAIFKDISDDVIQIDVSGRGILREKHSDTENRLREMWIIYDELTQHSRKDIGYTYDLRPGSLKKRKSKDGPGLEDATIMLFIVYKKPFIGTCDKFVLTTEMIVTNILDSIFVIPTV